jgi:hypothetical protein
MESLFSSGSLPTFGANGHGAICTGFFFWAYGACTIAMIGLHLCACPIACTIGLYLHHIIVTRPCARAIGVDGNAAQLAYPGATSFTIDTDGAFGADISTRTICIDR